MSYQYVIWPGVKSASSDAGRLQIRTCFGIQVRRISRQISPFRTDGLDRLANAVDFVGAQVVQKTMAPLHSIGARNLVDIGEERRPVQCSRSCSLNGAGFLT
jgi:hypothetical protein